MAKDTMMLFTSYLDKFKQLNNEQFGKLMRAMLSYQITGEMPEIDDFMVSLSFDVARVDIDAMNAKYAETCRKRSEAGKKGGAPAGNSNASKENKQNKQMVEKTSKTSKTSYKDNDNDNDKDKDNDSKKKVKKSTHKYGAFLHVSLSDDDYTKLVEEYGETETKLAIQKVDDYCEETGKRYKNYSLVLRRWGYKAVEGLKPNVPVLFQTPGLEDELKAIESLYMDEVKHG